ncbi:MAG: c-type cytochrome [Hyphomicrobiaceae bacterium]
MLFRPRQQAIAIGLILGMLWAGGPLKAETIGDPFKGESYAREICASCHAIGANELESPVAEATPLQIVANTPGMNRTALLVFFRTPHRTMPNLILSEQETDNVIAYIQSLKSDN